MSLPIILARGLEMKRALLPLVTFLLGILVAFAFTTTTNAFTAPTYEGGFEIPSQVYSGLTGRAIERISPGDHVPVEKIRVYDDRVLIDVDNVIFAQFTDTNSMDPVLDQGSNALEVVPKTAAEVNEGDIIAYANSCSEGSTIIHRVIKKGEDQLGTYYIAQGDNNAEADPCKIRFEEIKSVVIAIIY
jgi:hypothetical protein